MSVSSFLTCLLFEDVQHSLYGIAIPPRGPLESIVDEEGDLFYADEDETAVLKVNDQEYRGIFGESDVDESDFDGF